MAIDRLRHRTSCDECAVITVRDSGIGIPDEDLPHIFKRFYRGANALGRFNGTGLGLASVACIVELAAGGSRLWWKQVEDGMGDVWQDVLDERGPKES